MKLLIAMTTLLYAASASAASKTYVVCEKSFINADFATTALNMKLAASSFGVRLYDQNSPDMKYALLYAPYAVSAPTIAYMPEIGGTPSFVACVTVTGEVKD